MQSIRLFDIPFDSYTQEEGVPQGCVLSVTLFAIKINELANIIPHDPRYMSSLYVDDFQLSYRDVSLATVGEKLQEALIAVEGWCRLNGFIFSLPKTKAMHFTQIAGLHLKPDLVLHSKIIEYRDNFKFLGLIWDSRLSWALHISELKNKCKRMIGMLRSISSHDWGGDRLTLRHLYRVFIRSKLDYGSIVFNSASKTTISTLEPIVNECLMMITGCFKSTPAESLKVIANELPLSLRRDLLSLKYCIKTRSQYSNPAQISVTAVNDRLLFLNRRLVPTLAVRACNLLEGMNIETNYICPEFSYTLQNIVIPTWKIKSLKINDELNSLVKAVTPNVVYQQLYRELVNGAYKDCVLIYTDGSKTDEGVGAAAVTPNQSWHRSSLPNCMQYIWLCQSWSVVLIRIM